MKITIDLDKFKEVCKFIFKEKDKCKSCRHFKEVGNCDGCNYNDFEQFIETTNIINNRIAKQGGR